MITFTAIFLLYLTFLILLGLFVMKARTWLSRRSTHDGRTVTSGEVTRKGGSEIVETAAENNYPSPCLSCARKIDPVLCAGCSELAR